MASVITSNTGSGLALQPDNSGQLQFSTGYGGIQLSLANNVLTMGSTVNVAMGANSVMTMGDGSQYVTVSSFGMRNRIINGGMQIWQRGTSFSGISSGSYTADRMYLGYGGSAPTVTQVAGSTGFTYAARITGAVGNTVTTLGQKIESYNCVDLASKTVTVSVVLLASVAQTFSWYLGYANAADNFGSITQIATGSWSVTTTAATYSATISLPAGAANGLQFQVYPAAAGAFTSGTCDITGMQLELGTVATPFERRLIGQELANCQRYYQTFGSSDVPLSGYTDQVTITYVFPVQMRVTPGLTHPYTDGTYDSAGPAAGKWSFNRAYVTNIAKSAGTITSQTQIQNAWAQIYLYGMTLASVPTGINSNTQANITFSAEL